MFYPNRTKIVTIYIYKNFFSNHDFFHNYSSSLWLLEWARAGAGAAIRNFCSCSWRQFNFGSSAPAPQHWFYVFLSGSAFIQCLDPDWFYDSFNPFWGTWSRKAKIDAKKKKKEKFMFWGAECSVCRTGGLFLSIKIHLFKKT